MKTSTIINNLVTEDAIRAINKLDEEGRAIHGIIEYLFTYAIISNNYRWVSNDEIECTKMALMNIIEFEDDFECEEIKPIHSFLDVLNKGLMPTTRDFVDLYETLSTHPYSFDFESLQQLASALCVFHNWDCSPQEKHGLLKCVGDFELTEN